MADRYEDARGVIQDLLGPVDSVTEIFTRAGSVRGNHVHEHTTQWVYVVYGHMKTAVRRPDESVVVYTRTTGELFCEPPGLPHAWEALWDTKVLVFTIGPRSGENYESDTVRLAEEDRLL